MREKERDQEHTQEEADQLAQSTKKMKRSTTAGTVEAEGRDDVDMADIVLTSPNVPESVPLSTGLQGMGRPISYRDTL